MSFFQVTVDEVLARVEAVRTCPQCPGAGYVDAEPGEREIGTNWGRLRGQRLSVGHVGESWVPPVEVVGE